MEIKRPNLQASLVPRQICTKGSPGIRLRVCRDPHPAEMIRVNEQQRRKIQKGYRRKSKNGVEKETWHQVIQKEKELSQNKSGTTIISQIIQIIKSLETWASSPVHYNIPTNAGPTHSSHHNPSSASRTLEPRASPLPLSLVAQADPLRWSTWSIKRRGPMRSRLFASECWAGRIHDGRRS